MVPAVGFAILAVEDELVLDEVQLTTAILNVSKAIDKFFMNGFNEQYYLIANYYRDLKESVVSRIPLPGCTRSSEGSPRT